MQGALGARFAYFKSVLGGMSHEFHEVKRVRETRIQLNFEP